MLEGMVERFTVGEDNAVQDVAAILSDIRTQYDEVRCESDMKEKELQRFRSLIKQADNANGQKQDEVFKLDDTVLSLERQLEEGKEAIAEALMNRKVYEHMLERLKKEQAILKQKQLKMEEHLKRKRNELADIEGKKRNLMQDEATSQETVTAMRAELDNERDVRDQTMDRIKGCVEAKNQSIKRRADFERWRHVVALDAANEAFNASAGRLRKMWALEKLAGKVPESLIEQVEAHVLALAELGEQCRPVRLGLNVRRLEDLGDVVGADLQTLIVEDERGVHARELVVGSTQRHD